MPYKNKHSARIKEPGDFEKDSFRRKNIETGIDIIIGRLKGKTTTTTQAYRFKKDKYTPAQAKKWLKNHDVKYISFEPAEEEKQMKEKIEKRTIKTELRVIRKDDGSLPVIEGHAAVFNSDSEDMGFIERIRPGAFKEALKNSDIRSLFNHDANIVLGRNKSGTLELKEDSKGLFQITHPPDTQLVRDMVLSPIERGDIDQQSFGFTVEKDSWEGLDTDKPVRTIEKIKELFDVSVVTYPAYQDTSVALRSLAEARNQTIDEKNISVEIDGVEHTFNSHEEFDLLVEKINELRKNDASLSTAVLWEKKKASQKTAADDKTLEEDKTLIRLKTAGRKLSI